MRTRIGVAVILALALGCGKKGEDASGGSGGGSSEPGRDSEETVKRKREVVLNLRQTVLGMYVYQDVHGKLPGGTYPKNDTNLGLSWRVMILPYVEEEALYQEFKLDEAWDSDHNKKLIARMPKCFESGGASDAEGKTHFRAFAGRGAMIATPKRPPEFGPYAHGLTTLAIQDGFSNTLLIATLAEPIIWTKPDALDYKDDSPLPKFGGLFDDGFHIVMADGRVRFVPNSVPETTMRALITRDGGETVELPGEEIKSGAESAQQPKEAPKKPKAVDP